MIVWLTFLVAAWSCFMQKEKTTSVNEMQIAAAIISANDSFSMMQAAAPEEGDAEAGYRYITEGNAFSTGIPIKVYKFLNGIKNSELGRMTGYNNFTINDYVLFKNEDGLLTATPGCLHCHAQQFNGELIVGLGNSYSNFQVNSVPYLKFLEGLIKNRYGKNSSEWKTAERSFEAGYALAARIQTRVQGPAPGQKIAEVMASHRDPVTLKFRADTNYFSVPAIVIPEDVPALWIAKKRKAFNINAMRQGNLLQHITSTSILTLKDSAEAREIYAHAKDVWAYIKKLQAPVYPLTVNQTQAAAGKKIFLQTCAHCHGDHDKKRDYENELIPAASIGTDSLMWKYFMTYPGYTEWFNKSWFAVSASPASIKPQAGYVPPPLDGVWVTAPYLHNGSVPTIENVLNSKTRPRYWKRNFTKEEYDYEKLGWRYKRLAKPGGNKTYNTDIPGYGNYGHTYGDHLSDGERKAVIEYLKTL
jgi:Cytochrome c